ncbi:MAG: hypothetical protein HY656_07520 [Acidobacteria bacterium]|nr:hypothetical protein [Acidobacteriota bacterium]
MGRMLLGALVGSIVLFAWGFLYWAVLPIADNIVLPVPNEAAVAQMLKENIPSSGVYYIPGEGAKERSQAWVEKHKAGPIAQIFFRREGINPTDPMFYARGFGYMLFCAFLGAWLLKTALPGLESYAARAIFVVMVGFFGAAVAFSGAVWWYQWLPYHLLYVAFNVTAWVFAGLAMAAIVKPD